MSLGKGQLYKANSFDLGFINMIPVDIILQITNVIPATNELELAFVPTGVCHPKGTNMAIDRWFKEIYPSRSKENCMLKNASAFEQFVYLKVAIPEPCIPGYDLTTEQERGGLHKMDLRLNLSISSPTSSNSGRE